jgi:hypothetical protein
MQVSRVEKKLKANAPTTQLWLGAVGQGSNSRHARGVIDMETDDIPIIQRTKEASTVYLLRIGLPILTPCSIMSVVEKWERQGREFCLVMGRLLVLLRV